MDDDLENVYVIDTSVLITDPEVLYKLRRCTIVIPTAAVKELDSLKRSSNSRTARAAKRASRNLDNLGSRQNFPFGALTPAGSIVKVYHRHIKIDDLASQADNRIVGAAISLKKENRDSNVVVVTNDYNMRTITRSYGIVAAGYPLAPIVLADESRVQCAVGR